VTKDQKICSRCVLPGSFPGITFDDEGVCSACRDYEERWRGWEEGLPERRKALDRLVADAKAKKRAFDALVPLSGGKDSIYVLYLAVKELGLKCLAFTMDNGYLSDLAKENIRRACRTLGVEHVTYSWDPELMNRLFALFMRKTGYFCSICMRGISAATERVARMYNVPLVLGGSSARTEVVLSREMFQSGPVPYVKKVLAGEPLEKEARRLLYQGGPSRQVGYRLFWWSGRKRIWTCAWLDLPDYMEWNYDTLYKVIKDELGWEAPPDSQEHTDCGIHPVSVYLHNRRFSGLEIKRLTYARLIMAGQMSREEALERLEKEPPEECPESVMNMFLENMGMDRAEFDRYVDMGPRFLEYQPRPNPLFLAARGVKRGLKKVLGKK